MEDETDLEDVSAKESILYGWYKNSLPPVPIVILKVVMSESPGIEHLDGSYYFPYTHSTW